MVYLVLITTVILDYLVETTLKGEPGMVDFVFWIVYKNHSDCLYQFHFSFWHCIVGTLDHAEERQIQQVHVR